MPTKIEADVFQELCGALGYDPDRVLSVRVNRRKAVVTHSDPDGQLQSETLLFPSRAHG